MKLRYDCSRSVGVTRPAATASGLARIEARRLGHQYLGPEHLLVGLLLQGDNPAALLLDAHGLDLEAARTEVDRLVSRVSSPAPSPAIPSCWPASASTWRRARQTTRRPASRQPLDVVRVLVNRLTRR